MPIRVYRQLGQTKGFKLKHSIKINQGSSYKIGLNEVVGLEAAMREVLAPLVKVLRRKMYWNDSVDFDQVEYKSRDGFIPHSHNLGGLSVFTVVPKCEEHCFDFLTFGGYEYDASLTDEENISCEDNEDGEGHNDAAMRIWFKFEGIDDGRLNFYIIMDGGNGDAPYFRTQHLTDLYTAEFNCKSLAGIKRAASKHIKAILKMMGK